MRRNTASVTNPRIVFMVLLSLGGTMISASMMQLVAHGTIDSGLVDYYIAYLLPIISPVLSYVSVITIERFWMWYVIAFAWLSIGGVYLVIVTALNNSLSRKRLDHYLFHSVFGLGMLVFVGAIIGVIHVGMNMPAQQLAELYYALSLNFFALPIALFTDLMEFEPELWILIVLFWLGHLKMLSAIQN